MKLVLARTVRTIHFFVMLYLTIGWLSPPKYLRYYIIFSILVLSSWLFIRYCLLTKLEAHLRGRKNTMKLKGHIHEMLEEFFSEKYDSTCIDRYIRKTMTIFITIALIRQVKLHLM